MIYYTILVLVLFLLIQLENATTSIKNKNNYLLIGLLCIFCILGFRSISIGADTANYAQLYTIADSVERFRTYDNRLEPGFVYFMHILNIFSDNFRWMFIMSAALICISIYVFIKQNSTHYTLTLYFFTCMGFMQFCLTGLRQSMAIAICLFAHYFIRKKSLWKFLSIVAIAMTFHKTAIFFVPAYFIANMTINGKRIKFLLISMFMFFLFAEKILLFTADAMEMNYGIEKTDNGGIFLIIMIIISLLAYHNRHNLEERNKDSKYSININFIALTLWFVRMISRTAERVTLYFMPYTYNALSEYIMSQPAAKRQQYMLIAILAMGFLFLYRMNGHTELRNYNFNIL